MGSCGHKKKESINEEEFQKCLLENWAAQYVEVIQIENINAIKHVGKLEYQTKNQLLKSVYTKIQ